MRLVFDGLDSSVDLNPGLPSVLQVENQALFSRLISSMLSNEGRYALEPYAVWDEEDEIAPKDAFLMVLNPFDLPWGDRQLLGQITKRMEREFLDDEPFRAVIESMNAALSDKLMELTAGFSADYFFNVDWDLGKTLKTMGFGAGFAGNSKLVDELISFLSLTLDVRLKKTIVFVNLKTFLTEKELISLYEHIFYTKMKVLILENKRDSRMFEYEQKQIVDLDFLEY